MSSAPGALELSLMCFHKNRNCPPWVRWRWGLITYNCCSKTAPRKQKSDSPLRVRISHVYVMYGNLHLADSHFLHFTGDLDGVVDKEAAVEPVVRVEGHAQEAPLVPQPGRGHHLATQVQEGCL